MADGNPGVGATSGTEERHGEAGAAPGAGGADPAQPDAAGGLQDPYAEWTQSDWIEGIHAAIEALKIAAANRYGFIRVVGAIGDLDQTFYVDEGSARQLLKDARDHGYSWEDDQLVELETATSANRAADEAEQERVGDRDQSDWAGGPGDAK